MVIIGSDHSGVELKKIVKSYLIKNNIEFEDVTDYEQSFDDDYPDVAYNITKKVLENDKNYGIAICGTGIGISIACNKVKGIRAALCTDVYMAEVCRKHNNANILCLGARLECMMDAKNVHDIVDTFFKHSFEGGRHQRRLDKIIKIENEMLEGEG